MPFRPEVHESIRAREAHPTIFGLNESGVSSFVQGLLEDVRQLKEEPKRDAALHALQALEALRGQRATFVIPLRLAKPLPDLTKEEALQQMREANIHRATGRKNYEVLAPYENMQAGEIANKLEGEALKLIEEALKLPMHCGSGVKGRFDLDPKAKCTSWFKLVDDCIALCVDWNYKPKYLEYDPPDEGR